MKDMVLDIETSNYSYEIGGWDKTHLFDPVVVATWDGEEAHIFSKHEVNVADAILHPLHPRELGEHLQKHIEEGGRLIGHNIRGFDLPILKNALDCHYAGVLLGMEEHSVLDTAWNLRKISGSRIPLDEVCKATFGEGKVGMKSTDAPIAWREGRYDEVAKYCLEDCKLNLTLFKHGVEHGVVKSRNINTGLIDEIEVIW
jgi:DNA polymerase elongation subunit (family B)